MGGGELVARHSSLRSRGKREATLRGVFGAIIRVDRSQEIRAESKAGYSPTSAPSRASAASPDGVEVGACQRNGFGGSLRPTRGEMVKGLGLTKESS
jgi:hypothetical protein